jgi:hypothetical protein
MISCHTDTAIWCQTLRARRRREFPSAAADGRRDGSAHKGEHFLALLRAGIIKRAGIIG